MPRRPNTLPTSIYWLYDMRVETVALGYPTGFPFYCGKTVHGVGERLSDHRYTATKFPKRKLSRMLVTCGEFVRTEVKEIVPVEGKWADRERSWIRTLRHINSNCCNVSNGGDGPAGMIHSAETREKLRIISTGRKMPPGHGEKIAQKTRGQKRTPETRARMGAAQSGKTITQEYRDKISATLTGYKHAPGFGEEVSRRNTGYKHTDEALEKISAAHRGRVASPETRAKQSAAKIGKKRSPEAVEKSAAAHRGKITSPETRAKQSAAQKGRPVSEEQRAKLRLGQRRRRERELAAKQIIAQPVDIALTYAANGVG